jgi:type III restriction enzyme
MPAFSLKTYQTQALATLERFLTAARGSGSLDAAWANELARQAPEGAPGDRVATVPYRHVPFGDTPCVCLRIPTGGGKTLLASHAIPLMARCWRQADFPVVLWLVPSTTIGSQTLKALQQPGHPYRAALEAHYGQALAVLDLEAAPTLAAQDLGRKAIVLVATIQSFRVRQTQGRNVYAFSEEFDAHFAHFAGQGLLTGKAAVALERVSEADLADNEGQGFLTRADLGRVKHSLANLLALTRPLVVVDEAHNAKTDTTFETLKRVAPSVILELTATPVPKKTNVLVSVSARELQAEEMIKLPVMLAEHKAWPDAVRDAVQRRRQLEAECAGEPRYIRPIVLFQAQDKAGEVTAAVLRQHLLDEKHASEHEIVIATGDQRGLDGLNLFDPASPVRHVITVEALKEGWDCSFAYVLCSLQNVRSGKDVEQLLGRVLRMPYATRRRSPALNRAYAHVVARSFSEAATALVDRMVQSMGFEALDAAAVLLPDVGVQDSLFDAAVPPPAPPAALTLEVSASTATALQAEPDLRITLSSPGDDATASVEMADEVSDALLGRLLQAMPVAQHDSVRTRVQQHNQRITAARSPAQRGVPFAAMPRLCVGLVGDQAELHLFERDTLDEIVKFDLAKADPQPDLPGFRLVEQSDLFEIYVNQARVEVRQAQDGAQLSLDAVPTEASEADLVLWLVRALRDDKLSERALRAWCAALVGQLRQHAGFSLTGLLRARHALAQAALRRLDELRARARKQGFEQMTLLAAPAAEAAGWHTGMSDAFTFRYQSGQYPLRHAYDGRWQFAKHYFDRIHALKSQGEEFECAKALDAMPEVRHWVRNIEQQQRFSFWLPTATDYFYPDFVAELMDGRLLVVEYKGEAYATNDDSREKRAVGDAWARASAGRALFLMAERLAGGLTLAEQLRKALG